ncbi:NAD(P)/FAD-dependent oxidoreductase, partial [Thermobifida halotolerans]|uniref:NAD(P)/FAD-dependent oxidoreductase n=1 Tax=Thermobifida halotolerans TaxID=483545 RepID=UPI00373FD156
AAPRRHGARVHAFTPVTGLTRHTGAWRVHTAHDHYDTPVVVNAAGPWIAQVCALAGADVRMAPVAIQMHATVRVPPVLRHLVQHIGEGLSVKQVAAGNVLIGGGWPARRLDLAGRSEVSVESLVGNVDQAGRVLPFLAGLRLLRTWAGPLAATPDEMPLIGEVPGHTGLYVVGGTYAFTFAPLWAETLRRLVTGGRPRVDVTDFSPRRLMGTDRTAPKSRLPEGKTQC